MKCVNDEMCKYFIPIALSISLVLVFMFKPLKLLFILWLFIFSFKSYSYFEWKYFCGVEGNTIEVSIATGEQKCFPYLEQLSSRIDHLDEDIVSADAHIKAEHDIAYRVKTKQHLLDKQQALIVLRDQFVVAIDDYERELFLKVKLLVSHYLRPQREKVAEKIQQAHSLLFRLKLAWDEKNFVFVTGKLEQLERELMFLDRIKFAPSFDELIPPLKVYLKEKRLKN